MPARQPSILRPASRVWDGAVRSLDYPDQFGLRRVRGNGEIKWKGRSIFISKALRGEPIGLHRIDDDSWPVKYRPILLGTLKVRDRWRRA